MKALVKPRISKVVARQQINLTARRGNKAYQLIVRTLPRIASLYVAAAPNLDTMLAWNQRMRNRYSTLQPIKGRSLCT